MSTSTSTPTTKFDIDLAFELLLPGDPTDEHQTVAGKISASGTDIVIDCSDIDALLGTRLGDMNLLRGLADLLEKRGVTLEFRGPAGRIVRIGSVKASLAQRVVTGSRNIEVGRLSTLMPLLMQRSTGQERLSAKSLLPPATLFPLVPTVERNVRRTVTTTHYTYGSGRPRLIFAVGSERFSGQTPRVFALTKDVTTIGSSPKADLQIRGAEPYHAEIRHTREDEYVLHAFSEVGTGIDPSKMSSDLADGGVILRTGARVQIGEWLMAYYREEYADHGRPYGGRAGGEYAHQRPQPPRKNYLPGLDDPTV